eukprot:372493-Rhodomonas_salina.3
MGYALGYVATDLLCHGTTRQRLMVWRGSPLRSPSALTWSPTPLPDSYAISGTEIAYRAICLLALSWSPTPLPASYLSPCEPPPYPPTSLLRHVRY